MVALKSLWARFERRALDLVLGRLDERAFASHPQAEALQQVVATLRQAGREIAG